MNGDKRLNPVILLALVLTLFMGNVVSLFFNVIPAKAESNGEEIKDLGTCVIDLRKGVYTINYKKYRLVYDNICINCELGRIISLDFEDAFEDVDSGGEIIDLDKDGNYDIRIDYYDEDEGIMVDTYSKLSTCNLTGSYTIKCTASEYQKYIEDSKKDADSAISYYGKLCFKFLDEESKKAPETGKKVDTKETKKEAVDNALKTPSLKKIQRGNKSMTIKWKSLDKKALGNISGLEIQYSTDKNFKKNVRAINVSKKKKSQTIKRLIPGKKYYIRIRSIKNLNSGKLYSDWSKTKKVTIIKK